MEETQVLKKFRLDIEEAASDSECIESAYEEVIRDYELKYPQFKNKFKEDFNKRDQELRQIMDNKLNLK